MPWWQKVVLVLCSATVMIAVASLAVPNACGDFDLGAAFGHKEDIHEGPAPGQVSSDEEQQAERACIDDSRAELGRGALILLVSGTVLVALVAVPAVSRRTLS